MKCSCVCFADRQIICQYINIHPFITPTFQNSRIKKHLNKIDKQNIKGTDTSVGSFSFVFISFGIGMDKIGLL